MNKGKELEKLKKKMEEDDSLPLKSGATRLVFGDGNPESEILFIGEGPGYWEDQKGIPFVGNAGAFLNFLLKMIKFERKDVYITNVVHHRPPNNRDPFPEELDCYGKYLDKIIEIINPTLIVTLGRFSMGKFLPGAMISRVHGKEEKTTFQGKDIMVLPMYHPAAALRSLDVKEKLTDDFKRIPKVLEDAKMPKAEKPKEEENSGGEQMNLI